MTAIKPPSKGDKAALEEALPRPHVPFQRLEVEPLQVGIAENILYQSFDDIGTVALAPVGPVAYHDTKLSFFTGIVNIINSAIADMPAVQGLDAESVTVIISAVELLAVEKQVLAVGDRKRYGGIETAQFLVFPPQVVIRRVLDSFGTQSDLFAGDNHLL